MTSHPARWLRFADGIDRPPAQLLVEVIEQDGKYWAVEPATWEDIPAELLELEGARPW